MTTAEKSVYRRKQENDMGIGIIFANFYSFGNARYDNDFWKIVHKNFEHRSAYLPKHTSFPNKFFSELAYFVYYHSAVK